MATRGSMTLAQWSNGLYPQAQKCDYVDGRRHAYVSEGPNSYAIVDFGHYNLTHQDMLDIARVRYANISASGHGDREKRISFSDQVTILTLGSASDP